MLALIAAILGLPAALAALSSRVEALEAALADIAKSKALNSIEQTAKDTDAAKNSDDLRKVADENASNLRSL